MRLKAGFFWLFICVFFNSFSACEVSSHILHRRGSLKSRMDWSGLGQGWWRLFFVSFNKMIGITWSGGWQSASKDGLRSVMYANCDGEVCRSTTSHVDQLHSHGIIRNTSRVILFVESLILFSRRPMWVYIRMTLNTAASTDQYFFTLKLVYTSWRRFYFGVGGGKIG